MNKSFTLIAAMLLSIALWGIGTALGNFSPESVLENYHGFVIIDKYVAPLNKPTFVIQKNDEAPEEIVVQNTEYDQHTIYDEIK